MILQFPTVGIVGTTEYPNTAIIEATVKLIYDINPDTVIVSGEGGNVDNTTLNYAKKLRMNRLEFPAQWDRFNKRAGFIRNPYIADMSDYLIAFWDGKSNGTKDALTYFYGRVNDKAKRIIIPIVDDCTPSTEKKAIWQSIKTFCLNHLVVSADESQ